MRPPTPVRVLVCDSGQLLRERLRAHWEFDARIRLVGEASDGVEAIAAAARLQPDVILLDWQMPRLTGIEALPHIRQVVHRAAVVIWSANLSQTAEGAAEAAGADRLLAKPAELEELTAALLATAQERRAALPLSVLLAHRSQTWRNEARATLDRIGASVHEAESPEEAIDAARTHRPIVALVERQLIDCLPVGEQEALNSGRVIAIDGEVGLEEALAALESGTYDDLLIEPASPSELASRVRAAGDMGRLRDQITSTAARLAQLAELSQTDELTGLPNRRSLLGHLAALTSSARRHRRPLALAVLDIDRFKEINDIHGHQAGDEVLRAVARRLVARIREEDVAGRIGGDEFIVLLAEVDQRAATSVAQGLSDAIERRPVRVDGSDLSVAVSVGCVTWQGEEDEELLARADRALYAAKGRRPDQVGEMSGTE